MLAGAAFPPQKFRWEPWGPSSLPCSSSSKKTGIRGDRIFPGPSSSKHRSSARKLSISPASPHKVSCSCACFSCYSSYWSRWAASPNRDLLSKILEIVEMEEEPDGRKKALQKDKSKKQNRKRDPVRAGRNKVEEEIFELNSDRASSNSRSLLPPLQPIVTMDAMYNTLWDISGLEGTSKASECDINEFRRLIDEGEVAHPAPQQEELASHTSPTSRSICVHDGADSQSTCIGQFKSSNTVEGAVHGSLFAPISPADNLQSKSSRVQCTVKRKSSQIMPVNNDDTQSGGTNEGIGHVNENVDGGAASIVQIDIHTDQRSLLSRVLSHAVCEIATRIWDLVSHDHTRGH
ncbi:hypothetical protein KP509_28G006300 [Ceratopteris richardii]|nr:hypothetical protein KP509_28G006300 [Ceratopteris richardii]